MSRDTGVAISDAVIMVQLLWEFVQFS